MHWTLRLALTAAISVTYVHAVVEPVYYLVTSKPSRELTALAKQLGFHFPVRISPGRTYYSGLAVGFLPGLRFIVIKEHAVRSLSGDEVKALLAHETAHIQGKHVLKQTSLSALILFMLPLIIGSVEAMIVWLVFTLSLYLAMIRRFESNATRWAMYRVGYRSYVASMNRLEKARARGSKLIIWWYRFTHPHSDKKKEGES